MLKRVENRKPMPEYGGADARFDAQSNGQSDATHDRRRSAFGHPADDRLPERKNEIRLSQSDYWIVEQRRYFLSRILLTRSFALEILIQRFWEKVRNITISGTMM
jgi:hypothetical protein